MVNLDALLNSTQSRENNGVRQGRKLKARKRCYQYGNHWTSGE